MGDPAAIHSTFLEQGTILIVVFVGVVAGLVLLWVFSVRAAEAKLHALRRAEFEAVSRLSDQLEAENVAIKRNRSHMARLIALESSDSTVCAQDEHK
jgi:hypothetical protein